MEAMLAFGIDYTIFFYNPNIHQQKEYLLRRTGTSFSPRSITYLSSMPTTTRITGSRAPRHGAPGLRGTRTAQAAALST